MRKKRKLRGRAERAALAAAAAEAGVLVDESEGEAESVAESETDTETDPETESESQTETESESQAETESESESQAQTGGEGQAEEEGEEDEVEDDVEDAESATRPQAAQLDEDGFTSLVEALLFATDKPLTIARLRQLTRVSDTGRIQVALERLMREHAERGVVLSNISGGYSFRTHSRFSPWVQQLIQGRPVRLSRAQLETLALVAYRQPITRPEIDQIRGVDSGATLKLLLDRGLIRILGKREEVGRPLLYGTTREFLDFFSLNDLRELPTLREYSELTEESRSVVEKMGMEVPPVVPAEPESGEGAVEGGVGEHAGEVPAEALAPEMPADVITPEDVALPEDVAPAEDVEPPVVDRRAPSETLTDGLLRSPDPDSFDDANDDGSP